MAAVDDGQAGALDPAGWPAAASRSKVSFPPELVGLRRRRRRRREMKADSIKMRFRARSVSQNAIEWFWVETGEIPTGAASTRPQSTPYGIALHFYPVRTSIGPHHTVCQDFVLFRDQVSNVCCVLNCADGRFL